MSKADVIESATDLLREETSTRYQQPGSTDKLLRRQRSGHAQALLTNGSTLLGERIEASLKPNRVVVIAAGDTLNVLAERHGSTATIESWNASGYGPPYVKLDDLVRYTYEDVEAWLAQQIEVSRG